MAHLFVVAPGITMLPRRPLGLAFATAEMLLPAFNKAILAPMPGVVVASASDACGGAATTAVGPFLPSPSPSVLAHAVFGRESEVTCS